MTVTKSVPDNSSTIIIIYHKVSTITKAHCIHWIEIRDQDLVITR